MNQKREAPRVYAVIASSVEAALAELAGLTTDRREIEVIGALSPDLTRRLGMKPGEMRLL